MIYIVGDTHYDHDFTSLLLFAKQHPHLTKQDYVIVAGDCGACFYRSYLEGMRKYMDVFPFTLLFVDGNHENFDILSSYPKEEWNGGIVHKLFDDVIHLTRGQVFQIDGITFLTIGGAESTDKARRKEGISWWPEESITDIDIDVAFENVKKYENQVDYIITHTMPQSFLYNYVFYRITLGIPDQSEMQLEKIKEIVQYKNWFFGHWHTDARLAFGGVALYHNIYEITKDEIKLIIDAKEIPTEVREEMEEWKEKIQNN